MSTGTEMCNGRTFATPAFLKKGIVSRARDNELTAVGAYMDPASDVASDANDTATEVASEMIEPTASPS